MVICGPTTHITTVKRSTPGPKYGLPPLVGYNGHDTEATKLRAPAYSLRKRTTLIDKYKSPGPAAYLPRSGLTNTGRDYTPSYSLSHKLKEPLKQSFPGPDAYAPENYKFPRSRNLPAYSMGKRLKGRVDGRVFNPAPNMYTLPSRIGEGHPDLRKSPAYHMSGKDNTGSFAQDFAKTPGPAAYSTGNQNAIKRAPPEFSMRPRCKPPGDKTVIPGPASHKPEDCPHTAWSYKRAAPAYSFGTKHNEHAVEPSFVDC